MGSRLCALCVWLVAQYQFQLYDIHAYFLFALRAIQRKLYQNSICVDLRSSFSTADWAMNPQWIIPIVTHILYLLLWHSSALNVWLSLFEQYNQIKSLLLYLCSVRWPALHWAGPFTLVTLPLEPSSGGGVTSYTPLLWWCCSFPLSLWKKRSDKDAHGNQLVHILLLHKLRNNIDTQ